MVSPLPLLQGIAQLDYHLYNISRSQEQRNMACDVLDVQASCFGDVTMLLIWRGLRMWLCAALKTLHWLCIYPTRIFENHKLIKTCILVKYNTGPLGACGMCLVLAKQSGAATCHYQPSPLHTTCSVWSAFLELLFCGKQMHCDAFFFVTFNSQHLKLHVQIISSCSLQ